jgi:hypothetical protein
MVFCLACSCFLLRSGLSYAGMRLYVKPKEALERVAGAG